MAMTEDERIIEALAKSRYESNYGDDWDYQPKEVRATYREYAANQLTALRRVGGDVTMPPAPEPVYTIRLTEAMRSCGKHALANRYYSATNGWSDESAFALYRMLEDATPDPEPGA